MSKDKKIIICVVVAALVLLAVGLIFWLGRDKTAEAPEDPAPQEQAAETEMTAAPEEVKSENSEEESPNVTQTESAQLIEDGGEVIIVIPEGQDSDGF